MRNNKGMTMIELLGVITLLGIILVVAVPNVYKYATKSRNQAYDTMAKSLYEAAQARFMDDGVMLDVCVDSNLDADIRNDRVLLQREFAKPLSTSHLELGHIVCDSTGITDIVYNADVSGTDDLIGTGYIDPLVSPDRSAKACTGAVQIIKVSGSNNSDGVLSSDEYFYRVYIKCPGKEFTKVFTTTASDGEDADE